MKSNYGWIAKLGLSVGLMIWLLSSADLRGAWEQAARTDVPLLIVAAALLVAQTFLGAMRWWLILRALHVRATFGQVLNLFYIGAFFSVTLPGAAGGDAMRMWKASRAGISGSTAINSVILDRAITVFALVALVTGLQPILLARIPEIPGSWIFPLLSALGLAGLGVMPLLDRLPRRLGGVRLGNALHGLAGDSRLLLCHPRHLLPALVTAILGHTNLCLSVFAIATALSIKIDIIDCLVLVPPVILLTTLPITINGWGVRETAMVVAFAFIGIASTPALTISLLFGVLTVLSAIPGGVVWLRDNRRPIGIS